MSRLIDADKLIEIMDDRYKEKVNKVPDNLAEGFMQMEKLIKEQPTAFDVDKVVKELKTLSQRACNRRNLPFGNKEYERGRVYAFDDAIDVVKAGGRDD